MGIAVSECFHAIQGEGVCIGEPSVFFRTQGCNFGCASCDTQYAWPSGKHTTIDKCERMIHEAKVIGNCTSLVITGGEPFEQDIVNLIELLERLRRHFQHITIETAAFARVVQGDYRVICSLIDVLSISPKLPFFCYKTSEKKMDNYNRIVLEYAEIFLNTSIRDEILCLKWVIDDWKKQRLAVLNLLDCLSDTTRLMIVLQHNGWSGKVPADQELMLTRYKKLVRDYQEIKLPVSLPNARILPQLHRLVWGNERAK